MKIDFPESKIYRKMAEEIAENEGLDADIIYDLWIYQFKFTHDKIMSVFKGGEHIDFIPIYKLMGFGTFKTYMKLETANIIIDRYAAYRDKKSRDRNNGGSVIDTIVSQSVGEEQG